MISIWHLLWIVPLSIAVGWVTMLVMLIIDAWKHNWDETDTDKQYPIDRGAIVPLDFFIKIYYNIYRK